MTDRRLIDTNLLVRYLVKDHEQHAKTAAKLFEACDRGEITLVILPAVLAECLFVLESFYKRPRRDIGMTLSSLITSPNIEIADAAAHRDALDRYVKTNLHFVDCILAAFAASTNWSIATFDAGFKRFADVKIDLE